MGCHIKPEQFFNLIFGYNDYYWHYNSTTNWGADYNFMSGDAVPAGEVWVVMAAHIKNISRGASMAISVKNAAGQQIGLKSATTSVAGEAMAWSGMAILKEGDYIFYEIGDAVAGDGGNWGSLGYKMKVA